MLDKLFMQVLDMSRIASIVILVVILMRLLLKKAPKSISYCLWAVVLFRLLCPTSIKASVSVVPETTPVDEYYYFTDAPISLIDAGIAAYHAAGDAINGDLETEYILASETYENSEIYENGYTRYVYFDWFSFCILVGKYIWLAGVAVILIYSLVNYRKIRRKLEVVVHLRNNICIADDIQSPFVIGIINPMIYIPCGLGEKEQEYICRHEEYHIQRHDHICKALAFFALCLHWFNPLVWLAFVLASKDMEMSCDEAVVRKMGGEIRADYSLSLLALATGRRIIAGTPLAFGEGNAKERIKNLGNWKKPALWIVIVAVSACLLLTVSLATNPFDELDGMRRFEGIVTELQTDDNGDLTALIIETDEREKIGILFTEKTIAFPPGVTSGTHEELRAAFQAAIHPDMTISASCLRGKKKLSTDAEEKIKAYEGYDIDVIGELVRGSVRLRDGTQIDVLEEDSGTRTYRLADGTTLLYVSAFSTPENVSVVGLEDFYDLSEAAQERVKAFYGQRGVLYDEQEELERAYRIYQKSDKKYFSGCTLEQSVSPTASSERVMYFATSLILPAGYDGGGTVVDIVSMYDAFDRETGEHIDNPDLFSVSKETVVKTILDKAIIVGQPLRSEIEAAFWDAQILVSPDYLTFEFEAGTLPSTEDAYIFGLELTPAIQELMYDWAVPKGRD